MISKAFEVYENRKGIRRMLIDRNKEIKALIKQNFDLLKTIVK